MKLQIRIGNQIRPVALPDRLLSNRCTVLLLVELMKRKGILISAAQAERLMTELVDYGKTHPEWVAVQIRFRDGKEAF